MEEHKTELRKMVSMFRKTHDKLVKQNFETYLTTKVQPLFELQT